MLSHKSDLVSALAIYNIMLFQDRGSWIKHLCEVCRGCQILGSGARGNLNDSEQFPQAGYKGKRTLRGDYSNHGIWDQRQG